VRTAVIGLGYVGLPLALAFCDSGEEVIGFDTDPKKIEKLKLGSSYIDDVSQKQILEAIDNGKFKPSSDEKSLENIDNFIICVPTPLNSTREPDLTYLIRAAEIIAKSATKPALIVNESTSYPGTVRHIIKGTIESLDSEVQHSYAVSPERIDPGSQNWNIKNTPRLYCGIDESSSRKTEELYSKICEQLIQTDSLEIAEMAKLFENTFRQINIALVNELSEISESMSIPVLKVLDAANTKPYGFMKFNPGIGVGGHCIPVDPSYLAYISRKNGVEPKFINLANEINLEMPQNIVNRIIKDFNGSIQGLRVLIVGMSYKANISDTRESPSLILLRELRHKGSQVFWHDPLVLGISEEKSVDLEENFFDISIIAVLHDDMDKMLISRSANYIFDCSGKFSGNRSI